MRVLLDENLPTDLAADLSGVEATTGGDAGWGGVTNGELLRRIAGRFDALLTMDRNLQHQQNIAGLPFGVVLVRAPSNRLVHVRPLVPAILDAFRGFSLVNSESSVPNTWMNPTSAFGACRLSIGR